MCGRFAQYTDPRRLARRFEILETEIRVFDARPRYNVAPTQPVLAVRLDDEGERELVALTWGLLPFWAKESKLPYSTLNARAETVAEKPAYRQPFRKRRCLIPTDLFFEWRAEGTGKQPFAIGLQSGEPFALAGLWDRWDGEGQRIESCTIIVTVANPLMATIHDRMPVILPPSTYDVWLDPKTPLETAKALLQPYAAEPMRLYPVSRRVNSPRNDDPSLVEPEPQTKALF
ncbi:SOS response-associated peptidase [Methylocaldum sp.]|jgi:putative SOS response-associated peptidase YedK|uniref:SOS response-associated peptidase n=1 Tax=Methylocaldum sp. TaxID=1969727 RepID=UPI00322001A2